MSKKKKKTIFEIYSFLLFSELVSLCVLSRVTREIKLDMKKCVHFGPHVFHGRVSFMI